MAFLAEALALGRVWRFTSMMAFAVVVVVVCRLCAPVGTDVPGIEPSVPLLDMAAVLVGMVLPVGLLDRMPLWTRLSGRNAIALRAGRFGLTAVPLLVVVTCWTSAHPVPGRSWWAVCFFGLGCLAVPVMRIWFWAPVFVVGYGWLQLGHNTLVLEDRPAVPVVAALGVVVAAFLAYVATPPGE